MDIDPGTSEKLPTGLDGGRSGPPPPNGWSLLKKERAEVIEVFSYPWSRSRAIANKVSEVVGGEVHCRLWIVHRKIAWDSVVEFCTDQQRTKEVRCGSASGQMVHQV